MFKCGFWKLVAIGGTLCYSLAIKGILTSIEDGKTEDLPK